MSGGEPAGEAAAVSVVIVSWNAARYLDACLASVRGQTRRPARIVVVDNASADGSADVARGHEPDVEVQALDHNAGFCRANNIGIALTSTPFVLVLNPDTRLEPDFLERVLPAFDDPRVGIATGKLLRFDGITVDSAGQSLGRSRQPIDRGYGRPDDGSFDRDETVFGACGAAAVYRRAMLDSIADPGPQWFDETFFAFVEDLDVAWRARRLGWRAEYRHRAVGYHARGGSVRGRRVRRRIAAMLGRPPEIRFHIVKNRWLTMLRNDRLGDALAHAPWILGRDAATLLLLLVTSPGVLVRLWRRRELFTRARRLGTLDASRPRPHVDPGTE